MLNWKQVKKYAKNGSPEPPCRVEKSKHEWREELTAKQFQITRKCGTDQPFRGEYCNAHNPGLYACVCCDTELFNSTEKFESGSGWPSFTEPIEGDVIKYKKDFGLGIQRIEAQCNICDAHLGHVFPDGPEPTGLRFCLNSTSLQLIKES